jgi:DDE_Tnp_1-associated
MQTHPKLSLIEHFKELPDPRVQGRCDHDLIDVLVIAVCTLLSAGSETQPPVGESKPAILR